MANQWDLTAKGSMTKQFYPNIKDRLKQRLKITPNLTAIISAHGKTKDYLHRFNIIESPQCTVHVKLDHKQWIT
jgi:hypothetical protein